MVNVGKYTIHGSYGFVIDFIDRNQEVTGFECQLNQTETDVTSLRNPT